MSTTTLPSFASLTQQIGQKYRAQIADRSTDLDIPGYGGKLVLRVHPPEFDEDTEDLQDTAQGDGATQSRFDAMAELVAKCADQILIRADGADDKPGRLWPLASVLDDGHGPVRFDERFVRFLLTTQITDETPDEVAATIAMMADTRIAQMVDDERGASIAAVHEAIPYKPNLSRLWAELMAWIGREDNDAAEKALGESGAASSVTSPDSPPA